MSLFSLSFISLSHSLFYFAPDLFSLFHRFQIFSFPFFVFLSFACSLSLTHSFCLFLSLFFRVSLSHFASIFPSFYYTLFLTPFLSLFHTHTRSHTSCQSGLGAAGLLLLISSKSNIIQRATYKTVC